MSDLLDAYQERLAEVEAYLEFLVILENQARQGPPKIEGAAHPISAQQQKILYSSVFLQLYNLVESTMSGCIELVSQTAALNGEWKPGDLSDALRREWVRFVARTHVDLSSDNRLTAAVELCGHLVSALPIGAFSIEKGGGGNWDDSAIEAISTRLGFQLTVPRDIYRAVKVPIKNDLGPLGLVKSLRNKLAHGSISFEQCAEGLSVDELIVVKNTVARYMREVVIRFEQFTDQFEFLLPAKRPVPQ